jgi:hypothetical protein
MTLLRTALIWDINLTYQARVPKSEPTDNAQPNGSRLSCGRNARGRKVVVERRVVARRRGNATLPYLRAPGSFKRLLGGRTDADYSPTPGPSGLPISQ